jgi:chromosome segregation ATPase
MDFFDPSDGFEMEPSPTHRTSESGHHGATVARASSCAESRGSVYAGGELGSLASPSTLGGYEGYQPHQHHTDGDYGRPHATGGADRTSAFAAKIAQQAKELTTLQKELTNWREYAELVEARFREVAPWHDLPVLPSHLGQPAPAGSSPKRPQSSPSGKVKELQAKLQARDKGRAAALRQAETAQARVASLEAELQALKRKPGKVAAVHEAAELESLRRKLSAAEKQIEELQARVSSEERAGNEARAYIAVLEDAMKADPGKTKMLRAKSMGHMSPSRSPARGDDPAEALSTSRLRDAVDRLNAEKSALVEYAAEAHEKLHRAEEEIAGLKRAAARETPPVKRDEGMSEDVRGAHEQLLAALKQQRDEVEQAKHLAAEASARAEEADRKLEATERALDASETEREEAEQMAAQWRSKAEDLKAAVAEATGRAAQAEAALEEFRSRADRASDEVDAERRRAEGAVADKANIDAEASSLRARTGALEAEVKVLRQAIEAAEAAEAALQEQDGTERAIEASEEGNAGLVRKQRRVPRRGGAHPSVLEHSLAEGDSEWKDDSDDEAQEEQVVFAVRRQPRHRTSRRRHGDLSELADEEDDSMYVGESEHARTTMDTMLLSEAASALALHRAKRLGGLASLHAVASGAPAVSSILRRASSWLILTGHALKDSGRRVEAEETDKRTQRRLLREELHSLRKELDAVQERALEAEAAASAARNAESIARSELENISATLEAQTASALERARTAEAHSAEAEMQRRTAMKEEGTARAAAQDAEIARAAAEKRAEEASSHAAAAETEAAVARSEAKELTSKLRRVQEELEVVRGEFQLGREKLEDEQSSRETERRMLLDRIRSAEAESADAKATRDAAMSAREVLEREHSGVKERVERVERELCDARELLAETEQGRSHSDETWRAKVKQLQHDMDSLMETCEQQNDALEAEKAANEALREERGVIQRSVLGLTTEAEHTRSAVVSLTRKLQEALNAARGDDPVPMLADTASVLAASRALTELGTGICDQMMAYRKQLTVAESRAASLDEELARLRPRMEVLAATTASRNDRASALLATEAQLSEAKSSLAAALSQRQVAVDEVSKLRSRVSELEREIDDAAERLAALATEADVSRREKDQALRSLGTTEAELEAFRADVRSLRSRLEAEQALNRASSTSDALAVARAEAEKERSLSGRLEKTLSETRKRLAEFQQAVQSSEREAEECKHEAAAFRAQADAAERRAADLQLRVNSLEAEQSEVDRAVATDIEALTREAAAARAAEAEMTHRVEKAEAAAEASRAELGAELERHEITRRRLRQVESEKAELEAALSSAQRARKHAEGELSHVHARMIVDAKGDDAERQARISLEEERARLEAELAAARGELKRAKEEPRTETRRASAAWGGTLAPSAIMMQDSSIREEPVRLPPRREVEEGALGNSRVSISRTGSIRIDLGRGELPSQPTEPLRPSRSILEDVSVAEEEEPLPQPPFDRGVLDASMASSRGIPPRGGPSPTTQRLAERLKRVQGKFHSLQRG